MRHPRRAAVLSAAALLLGPVPAFALAAADSPAGVQPWLQEQLADAGSAEVLRVYVHADTATAAREAVAASGLRLVEVFDKVAVAVADGTPAQIDAAREQDRVTYVEGDLPVVPLLDTSHVATRGAEAVRTLNGTDGSDLDGSDISIAVIDSGIDGTHPFFREADGSSKVVRNLKSACLFVSFTNTDLCFTDVPGNDSDTLSTGGHGTHVAGIAAGNRTTLANGKTVQGAAPGAKLVGLAVGQAVSVYGGNTGLNWVLNHHAAPCGAGVSVTACPPIRVTNNSYGAPGGSAFDPNGVTAKLQRSLLAQGVLTVWAAGNDGGDGSGAGQTTNGPGMDPTPGILMVASYDDDGTGTRNGALSSFSSRGVKGSTDTYPDISAPGDTILSACRPYLTICNSSATLPVNGPGATDVATFNTISGTSMAAPHIAGIVAQLLEGAPKASPADIEHAIENGAHRFAAGGAYEADPLNLGSQTSFDKGHGLVDVMGAYALLTGTTAPPVVAAACTDSYTDGRGDATNLLGNPGLTPNDPSLDVVGGTLSTEAGGVRLTVEVDDLVAGPNGQIVEQTFGLRGTSYYALAQRATATGAMTFRYGDQGGTGGGRRQLGTTTGTFDAAADTISILFPRAALSPALADGEVLGGLTVTTRRDAVLLIPDADTATAGCPYTLGTTSADGTPTSSPTAAPTLSPTSEPSPTGTATSQPTTSPSPTRKGGKPTSTSSPSCKPKGCG